MGLDMPPHFQDVPGYQICYVTGKVRIGKDTCSFDNRPAHVRVREEFGAKSYNVWTTIRFTSHSKHLCYVTENRFLRTVLDHVMKV